MEYRLIDSGNGEKLEQFGPYRIIRPCSQAVWEPQNDLEWEKADARFSRDGKLGWEFSGRPLPEEWSIDVAQLRFRLQSTDFGHLGIFPEQCDTWQWIQENVDSSMKVLNLFAYSGGSTLAAARAGAEVCHLDASQGMVQWARQNAELNGLRDAPIRWIVDDVQKFLLREVRRGRRYDAIILDPPTFGRGKKGEIFKIEEDLLPILDLCRELLSDQACFVILSCHTPGYTPITLEHLLTQCMQGLSGTICSGEMLLKGEAQCFSVPSGTFARWTCTK